ncbi:MAG: YeeE/YedE family protein [Rhizobacter sp.]
MNIDWNAFTPGSALLGGVLIGLAVALLVLGSGRIAGISGIVGTALSALSRGAPWAGQRERWAFIAGLLGAPLLWHAWASLPATHVDTDPLTLVIAGVVVGFGTRLGGGCTSGHGVCGLSRLSLRSLVATAVFMLTGVATVFVLRHAF